jgi:hypothetical protein
MRTYLPRQPDTYPLPRMAYDAALPSRRRLARDEGPDPASALAAAERADNPADALRAYFSAMLSPDHEHQEAIDRMIDDLANWNGEPAAEDRKRKAMDGHPRSPADRIRDAEVARQSEARAELARRFPDFNRIRSA